MSIPRPTRAECEAILGKHVLYWCSQCGQAWSLPERESHLVLCRPSSPEHYRHILTIDAAALAHAYLALLDENEALAKALESLTDHVEQLARESYLEDTDIDPELFDAVYEDVDHEQWLLVKQCRAALAEYAKRKQEGK